MHGQIQSRVIPLDGPCHIVQRPIDSDCVCRQNLYNPSQSNCLCPYIISLRILCVFIGCLYICTFHSETLQPSISSVVVSNSLDFANISWDAPSAVDLVSGYDVQVVPHVGGTPQSPLNATSSSDNRSYQVMQSLMPETLYTFQVRARTSVGTSQWSIPVAVNTLPPGLLTGIICTNTA